MFWIAFCAPPVAAAAANPEAEDFVRAQVSAGAPADLKARFETDEQRTLSAVFVRELLTGADTKVVIGTHGIHIDGAVVADELDLRNAKLGSEVILEHFRFLKSVQLSSADLASRLSLRDSELAGADLTNIHTGGDLALDGVVFNETLKLSRGLVDGALSLKNAHFQNSGNAANFYQLTVRKEMNLEGAVFHGSADFTTLEVGVNLKLSGALFDNPSTVTTLDGIKVHQSLFLTGAYFAGPFILTSSQVDLNLVSDGARFTDAKRGADMSGTLVKADALFSNSEFLGPTSLNMDVGHSIWADNTHFGDAKVSFNGTRIGGHLEVFDSVFDGDADFTGADIKGEFNLDRVRFANPLKSINFNTVRVGTYVFMREGTSFAGPVDFSDADIAIRFDASGARFNSSDKPARFDGMKVGQDLFLEGAAFDGDALFNHVTVAGSVWLDDVRFTGRDRFVSLQDMHAVDLIMKGSDFAGGVDLSRATLTGDLSLESARFLPTQSARNLSQIRASNVVLFATTFNGTANISRLSAVGIIDARQMVLIGGNASEVQFTGSRASDLLLADARLGSRGIFDFVQLTGNLRANGLQTSNSSEFHMAGVNISGDMELTDARFDGDADFRTTSVGGDLWLAGATFLGIADFSSMKVVSNATLPNTKFLGRVFFADAKFGRLNLADASVPADKDDVHLERMTYQVFEAGDDTNRADKLLGLADRARYDSSIYTSLEAFERLSGQPERGNDMYIAGRQHQRAAVMGPLDSIPDYVLEYVVCYGKCPGRAFAIGVGFVVLETVTVFSPHTRMEFRDPKYNGMRYGWGTALWYSLDQFLPFVDLGADSIWMPDVSRRFAWHYLRVHTLLGWIQPGSATQRRDALSLTLFQFPAANSP